MKDIAIADKDYKQWVSEVRGRYRQSQIKAAVKVNSEMLQFYWSLGHDIVERQMENTYGSGFFKRLSADLQRELPDAKGFSPINIRYFKAFYENYICHCCKMFRNLRKNLPTQMFRNLRTICSVFLGTIIDES